MPAKRTSEAEKKAKGVHLSARSASSKKLSQQIAVSELLNAEPPRGMTADAKAAWRLALENAPRGYLAVVDLPALERWCGQYALYRKLAKQVGRSEGNALIMYDDKGNRKLAPEFAAMLQLSSAMLKLEKEFGFTPVSRARAPAPESTEEKENDFADFGS
jgi:P27 family predicted phage terminase small subunit